MPDFGTRLSYCFRPTHLVVAQALATQTDSWATHRPTTTTNFRRGTLAVIMSRETFRTARGRCNLYKAHGCAVLARENSANREYLIAQTADIAKWPNASIYAPMVERLRTLARTRKSLMLGLSVQDYNRFPAT